ncbi:MAG: HEAT repeat domain-containing protein [Anaerolineae bacterium]|nr:HEAT repeat domain-containing protein [Anaerolineae bacterium]
MTHTRNVDALIAILRDPRRGLAVQDEAVRQLARYAEEAIPPLIALLSDDDMGVRGRAAAALGRCGARAIAPLRAALPGAAPLTRRGIALALGLTRSARAVRPLVGLLADPDVETRRRAAIALGWLGNDYALDALTAALNDEEGAVRAAAQDALARIRREPRSP